MIVLDTHVWLWWTSDPSRLTEEHRHAIEHAGPGGIAVSAISCWEVAKLVEVGRLDLDRPVADWLRAAVGAGRVTVVDLSVDIITDSTQLPGTFHRDPADQLIVATARTLGCRLLTSDRKILAYPHVETGAREPGVHGDAG